MKPLVLTTQGLEQLLAARSYFRATFLRERKKTININKFGIFEASKLVSTKTLLLKLYGCRQGKFSGN